MPGKVSRRCWRSTTCRPTRSWTCSSAGWRLERQRIIDQLAEYERIIADLIDILAKPERQRKIISEELAEIVEKYGDERRTEIIAAER